jgi:hypothetical protein
VALGPLIDGDISISHAERYLECHFSLLCFKELQDADTAKG